MKVFLFMIIAWFVLWFMGMVLIRLYRIEKTLGIEVSVKMMIGSEEDKLLKKYIKEDLK